MTQKLIISEMDGEREDIDRIINVLLRAGYEIDRSTASAAWQIYSEREYAAAWMMLPESDEDIVKAILLVTIVKL